MIYRNLRERMQVDQKHAFLVATLARLLQGRSHALIGTNSPAPTSAALLARELSGLKLQVTIIGSDKYNFFTDDLGEGFDTAARGIFDAFFLGGGQIDGQANINLVGVGDYPKLKVRWPGSHGTPLLYMMIPNAILFREDHTTRSLVERVDFISAPGVSAPDVHRPGGPVALVTSRCVFTFDRSRGRFHLASVHPGHDVGEIIANTGFDFDQPPTIHETPQPTPEMLRLLRDKVVPEVASLYPVYAADLLQDIEHQA
jgi:glutaconate CoA-transferase, subunit B